MDYKKEIIQIIKLISGRYSPYEIFCDWVQCTSLSISNACCVFRDEVWKEREEKWRSIASRYTSEEMEKFGEMVALLCGALKKEKRDVLGEICMETGMGSKAAGQFFSPFEIAEMCASITNNNGDAQKKKIIIDSACGGGGMIIATAAELEKRGINYQKTLKVIAQDLDWKAVHMCYVQLSLLGVDAVCVQGDALEEAYDQKKTPKQRVLITPNHAGMLLGLV